MSAGKPCRFGVSEFTTWPWPLERDVETFLRVGIEAIEICEFKLDRNDYAAQLSHVRQSGLTVSSVQTTIHSLYPDSLVPAPLDPKVRVEHIKDAIARIGPHVPPGTPFVVITGAAPSGNTQRVHDEAVRALYELAEHAREIGVRIAFEPLNPILFNTDTALWGLDRGLDLVREVDHPHVGLCVDTWNVFETPQLEEAIAAAGERIFIVQVSDWRRPRANADRRSLGDGTIDHVPIVEAIRETGYDGPYVLEIFSEESLPDSIWRGDLERTLSRNRDAFARICGLTAV